MRLIARAFTSRSEATRAAALIATFYGRRDQEPIRLLHKRLYRSLAPEPKHTTLPDKWKNSAERTFGRRFDPPGRAHYDTTAIQVALNAPGGATEAWEIMRQKLEQALDAGDLDEMWGYTLVYQAVLNRGIGADVAFEGGLPAVRRLRSTEGVQSLAQADVPGGRVWLLAVPERDGGLSAGTVYVALGPPEGEEELLDQFYGPAAKLLAPDLIAHKGSHQMRQYRGGDLERRYEENLRYLQDTTDGLLEDLEQRKVMADRLEELFSLYYRLLPVVSGLKKLHVGLLQQLHNSDWWRGRVGGDVVEFHHKQLETAARELELEVETLQHVLETADKAVSVAQVQVEKEQEIAQQSRQWRVEVIVAAVTLLLAVLALLELIDQDAPKALLGPFIRIPPDAAILLLGVRILISVAVAVVLIVLAICLVVLAIYLFEKRRGRGK